MVQHGKHMAVLLIHIQRHFTFEIVCSSPISHALTSTALNVFSSTVTLLMSSDTFERRKVLEGLTVQRHVSLYLITVSFVLQVSTILHSAATPTPPSSWARRWARRRRSWPQSRSATRPNRKPISAGSLGGWSRGEATLVAVGPPSVFCLSPAEQYNIAKAQTPPPHPQSHPTLSLVPHLAVQTL